MKVSTALWWLAYASTGALANWAVVVGGFVPVGFGLLAPAGVYVAGAAFTLRDLVRETGGRRWMVAAIFAGAVASYFVAGGRLALASSAAFLLSESADALVYEPLRRRGMVRALLLSNLAGLTLDSVAFLYFAFGSLDFLAGQIVGKGWMTLLAVLALQLSRVWRTRWTLARA